MQRLTYKQKRFAENYVASKGNATQAVKLVYDPTTDKTVSSIVHDNLRKPHIQEYIQKLLKGSGMDDQTITDSMKTILQAGISKKSLRKASAKDATRILDMALRIRDLYPSKKIEQRSATLTLTKDLNAMTGEQLQVYLENLTTEMKNFNEIVQQSNNERNKRNTLGDSYYQDLKQRYDTESGIT